MPRKYKQNCLNCNTYYEGGGVKFCSPRCFSGYKLKSSKPRKMISKICPQCNKEFMVIASKSIYRKRTYCSHQCNGIAHRVDPKIKRNCIKPASLKSKYLNMTVRAKAKGINICSIEQFLGWFSHQDKKCNYCDIPSEIWETLYYGYHNKFSLSVDRKDNTLGYVPFNMTLACGKCNAVKTDVLRSNEMLEIGQKYIKPKWQSELSNKENYLGKI